MTDWQEEIVTGPSFLLREGCSRPKHVGCAIAILTGLVSCCGFPRQSDLNGPGLQTGE